MKVLSAIQCSDRRTKQVGTFGYFIEKPLYSVTPVFPDYVQLADYCNKHGIERDESGIMTYLAEKQLVTGGGK